MNPPFSTSASNSSASSGGSDTGTVHTTGQTAGSNDNIGLGSPEDFDCDGTASVPIVDASDRILLIDADGVERTAITGSDAEQPAETPVPPADIDDDGAKEAVYLGNNDSPAESRYADGIGNGSASGTVRAADGERIEADTQRGAG